MFSYVTYRHFQINEVDIEGIKYSKEYDHVNMVNHGQKSTAKTKYKLTKN